MENKKTLEYLNSKAWYRFLKVIFLGFFLISLVLVSKFVIDTGLKRIDNNRTQITCKTSNKNTYTAKELNIKLTKANFIGLEEFRDDGNKILKTCGGYIWKYSSGQTYIRLPSEVFDIKPVYTYGESLKYLIFYNFLIVLCFEIFKRVFYYIILGKIKPEK